MAFHEDPELSVPSEIIFDIFTRLPVQSLLRLRCVCKLWLSVISDPYFVKSHLSLSTTNNLHKTHRLVFSTENTIKTIKSCVLYDGGSVNDALELDCPLKHPSNSVWIAGCCNGLLLIAKEDKYRYRDDVLFIWNPSTRTSITLPNCGSSGGTRARPTGHRGWYQFGYDESTDDYKVVAISCILWDQSRCDTVVKIYSLKTGIWKEIHDFRNGFRFPFSLSVKYLNGALYWTTSRKFGLSCPTTIVSLDLANEAYGEILQPVYDHAGDNALRLGVLGEWLCVLCDYRKIRVDVWVMKVKDYWTKLVSIPYMNDLRLYQITVPLCISNDGKVLLKLESSLDSKLVVYDSKICSVSVIQNFNEHLEAFAYVESLVSPAGPRDNNQG